MGIDEASSSLGDWCQGRSLQFCSGEATSMNIQCEVMVFQHWYDDWNWLHKIPITELMMLIKY